MNERERATWVALKYHGTPYRWGGDDPDGFDCSGYVIEALQSVGRFPEGMDTTAHGLFRRYPSTQFPRTGCLVFYGSAAHITHVAWCLDKNLAIGANGGGSFVRSHADAMTHNAFIKIRPIYYRADVVGFADPFSDPEEPTV